MSEKLITDTSVSPYFDDFEETKRFAKILFKPSVSVQTRELNQLQTLLQNQIGRFGDNIFKDGTIIDGVALTYNPNQDFIRVVNNFDTSILTLEGVIANNYLVTSNTGVRANIDLFERGFEATYPATNILYLSYITTGKDVSNNDVSTFSSGEKVYFYNENQDKTGTLDANNLVDSIDIITANSTIDAIGEAYSVKCSDGIVYQKGYFSKVDSHRTLVRKYDTNTTNMAVGFKTDELIIDSLEDTSLLDNALGQPNETAPGADRLKLEPKLFAVDLTTLDEDTNFFPVVEFNEEEPAEQNTNTVYNVIGDEIALRTKEESGNYVVKPFVVETLKNTANTSQMFYQVSPGIGYVNGYRVELVGSKKISVDRAISTDEAQAQIVTTNYGNYVIIDDVAGNFDFDNFATVSIYDAAQNALSSVNGAGSVPSGSVVGTAKVRSMSYNTGEKGTPDCQYRLYLFDISMNSGKSFQNDAKSFYLDSTYGKAKGDIVLEGSKALIKEANRNKLYFDIGTDSIKRLTDQNGVNDTQFIFRDTATATIQANGFMTVTTNTPYAGGNERLNYSSGSLSDTNELFFDLALSTEAYSANLAGTVTGTGNTTLTGSGTSFTTDFEVDDYIRIPGSGATRRITSISNNTILTVNASITETSENYQRFYPEGHIIDLSSTDGSINVISNTQFSVATELSLASGSQTVYVNYPVLRSTAVGISKEINKDRYVKIDCATAGIDGPYNLGLIDVTKVSNIYVGTDYQETNPDRTNWFYLDNGQRADSYKHAQLLINPDFKDNITASTKLLVKLDHFSANTTAGAGFFSIDSYPVVDSGDVANSTNYSIGDVPTIDGQDFRRFVDFRLMKYNTANSSSTIVDATENPTTANSSYITVTTGSYIPEPDSNFQADIEYYLPRIDKVAITKDGDIINIKGDSDVNPKSPISNDDSEVIAEVYIPGYPSLTTREGAAVKRTDIQTSVNLTYNAGYTMKDIGVIDERVKRLEYYTALNLLEQQTKDLTIPDENGLDRFKNGFFAEPFANHRLGRVNDFEYKIAVDTQNKIGRPFFKKHSIDYKLNTALSTNIQVSGSKVTLPYTSKLFVQQRFATKVRNCTESVWKWNGDVTLYPQFDHHREETTTPAVNVDIDLATPWEQFANSPFGTQFGDWRTTNTRSSSNSRTRARGRTFTTTTTTNTTTEQEQIIQSLNVDVSSLGYNFGSYVNDVSISPFIRSRQVAFVATGMKPNTRMYFYFDGDDVSQYCAPGELSGVANVLEGQENRIVNRTGEFGSNILSDDQGNVIGIFNIPADTFRVGDRSFVVTNTDNLETGAIITQAASKYTASSVSVSKNDITLNTRTPSVSVTSSRQNRTLNTTTVQQTSTTLANPRDRGGEGGEGSDPIAYSYLAKSPTSTTVFIDKIGVYFKKKDPSLGVTCYVSEMRYGVPDSTRIIAKKRLEPADVNVSDDASAETVFDFEDVIPNTSDNYYAVQIKPDGDSPEYEIWLSKTGQRDVQTNEQVFNNPYVGVVFVSANQSTWTAVQDEDMKINIYRCQFSTGTGTAYFENEDDEFFSVDGITKANSAIAPEPGDLVYTANTSGDPQTGNTDPIGYIQRVDEAINEIIIDQSSGGFSSNDDIQIHREFLNGEESINANTLIATATIDSVDNREYSLVVPRYSYITPGDTSIEMSYKGTDTTYNVDNSFITVTPETDNERNDKVRQVVSKSNEINNMSSNKSSIFNISMTTNNDFISPIVDMIRKNSYVVENIINNDDTDEHTRYGSASTRYICNAIELAEGQDAEDIEVFVGAHRPVGTDVKVYAKFLNGEDGEGIDDKVWTELTLTQGDGVFTSLNQSDFSEYKFNIPSTAPVSNAAYRNVSNDNIVQYEDTNGVVYVGYKIFMIKVVLLSDSKAKIPLLADLRAICLQV